MNDSKAPGTAATRLLDEWDALPLAAQLLKPDQYGHPAILAELERRYPHPARIITALRLSRDTETCRDLLNGHPVDPGRLDQRELARAKNRKLVRLDMTALDDLAEAAA